MGTGCVPLRFGSRTFQGKFAQPWLAPTSLYGLVATLILIDGRSTVGRHLGHVSSALVHVPFLPMFTDIPLSSL